jgi:hypothetical protein
MMISSTWRTSIVRIARGCRPGEPHRLSGWLWRLACFRADELQSARAAMLIKLASSECGDPTRTDSTDRTSAGEDRILSLIGINGLELQMRNVLSHD